VKVIWEKRLSFDYGVLDFSALGFIFGTVDGIIRIFKSYQEHQVLETKGGAILSITLNNVTKFTSDNSDIIVGDRDGNVTVFSQNQILSKHSLGAPITEVIVDIDSANNMSILAGDSLGVINAFGLNTDFYYKIRLGDDKGIKSMLFKQLTGDELKNISYDPSIKCLHVVSLKDMYGVSSSYLIVSDGSCLLHFYCQGNRVYTTSFPANISQVCSGYFIHKEQLQLAVGCDDGFIYLYEKFVHKRLINVGYNITKLVKFTHQENQGLDMLLCAGQFNALKIYQKDQLLIDHKTSDWVHSVATFSGRILIGKLNREVEELEIVVKKK